MNSISCDICMDLIPLVKDNVASLDSCEAVKNHIKDCDRCREVFNCIYSDSVYTKNQNINDRKIISKIKNQLVFIAILLVVIGSFVGVFLSEGNGMFYNILIMPTIGALGFYALKKKSYLVMIGMFVFVYVYHLIKYLIEGVQHYTNIISLIQAPLLWALIYTGLCGIGVLIGYLLYIAFKKEDE